MSANVAQVRFTPVDAATRLSGLLGYVSLNYGALRLDGLTLRRTQAGELTLSFPARRDRAGRDHSYIRPLDDESRRDIQWRVFEALGLVEGDA